jgi:hypothetical protein
MLLRHDAASNIPGDQVSVTAADGKAAGRYSCDGKFVPMR